MKTATVARPVMTMETLKELAAPVKGVIGEVVGSGPDRLCCIVSLSIGILRGQQLTRMMHRYRMDNQYHMRSKKPE